MSERIVTEFEVIDHGVDYPDYFPGCGVAYTKFEDVATGIGSTRWEAFDDAVDMLAQNGWNTGLIGEAKEQGKNAKVPKSAGEDAQWYVSIRVNGTDPGEAVKSVAVLNKLRADGSHNFHCYRCGLDKPHGAPGTVAVGYGTGSGYDPDAPICYECCGELDALDMRNGEGRATLYLTEPNKGVGPYDAGRLGWVTNWPGTLRMSVTGRSRGNHNMAGERIDVSFVGPDGRKWYGTQYGRNTQIVHCRRVKA